LEQKLIVQNEQYELQNYHQNAFFSKDALRIRPELNSFRPAFCRDADRILHSLSFARFFDKTQVFFWINSDIHQHRMLHVQLVSKIARYLAKILRLNEDLVEAISLGHDIGHVPFGHDGERILDELCQQHRIGRFYHNYESIWFLQEIEMQNLTLPVLDGILSHNGESHFAKLHPDRKTLIFDHLFEEMEGLKNNSFSDLLPKTLEGCLVRFVDTISYISRDVMDAENLGFLHFEDIPEKVKLILGASNRDIINVLSTDLIQNSLEQDYIAYSPQVFDALQELYQFNYQKIYTHPEKMQGLSIIREAFKMLWDYFYEDLIHQNFQSKIYTDHLKLNLHQIATRYPEINSLETYPYAHQPPEIIVRDFLAGCTDQYFWMLAKTLDPQLELPRKTIY
jgi:dGTPase